MTPGITVVIPTHPARMRNGMLERALRSVYGQELQPDAISIAVDSEGDGAARTRERALAAASTKYIAFLDSDDVWKRQHLKVLASAAEAFNAAFVFSWFEPIGMTDPLGHFGKSFDPSNPHHTTMTVLCRTDVAQEVGFTPQDDPQSVIGDEDWGFISGFSKLAVERGLRMMHVPEVTWEYHYHGRNTSGLPQKGDGPDRWK